MGTHLDARLLGRPEILAGGRALAFGSRKALLLASRVLLTREAHGRPALAALLWGADSPRHALGSLRVALTKIPAPVMAQLVVTRDAIAARPGAVIGVDVERFVQECAAGDAESAARAVAL